MYNFKRGVSFIATNPISYVFAIIVTVLCMTGIAFIANYVSSLYKCLNIIGFSDTENIVYVSKYYKTADFDETRLKGDFLKLKEYSGRYFSDNGIFNYVTYDEILADNILIPLEKGEWFTKTERKDGEINAVIAKNDTYTVGDLIKIRTPSSELYIRITGVLPRNFQYVKFGGFSYPSDISMVLQRFNSEENEGDYFIIYSSDIVDENIVSRSYMYLFDNLNDNEMLQNIGYLKKFANISSLKEMRSGSINEINTTIEAYLPTILLSSLLCVASLIAISFITVGNNKKNLSILYFCGATKKDIFAVIIGYVSTIFLPTLVFFGIINGVLYDKLLNGVLIAVPWVFVVVIATAFTLMICLSVVAAHFADKNISKTIKEE